MISRHPNKKLKTNLWKNTEGAPTSHRLEENLVSYFLLQWKLTIFELISFDVTFCVSQRKLEMLKSGRVPHHHGPSPTTPASWHSSDGFSRERSATSCSTLRLLSLRYKKQTNKSGLCARVLVWITPISGVLQTNVLNIHTVGKIT